MAYHGVNCDCKYHLYDNDIVCDEYCNYFVYKMNHEVCQLLQNQEMSCDLLKGVPYPMFDECTTISNVSTTTTASTTSTMQPEKECSNVGACDVRKMCVSSILFYFNFFCF